MFADESDEVCRLCYHLSSTFTEGVGRITASDQTVQAVHSCISWLSYQYVFTYLISWNSIKQFRRSSHSKPFFLLGTSKGHNSALKPFGGKWKMMSLLFLCPTHGSNVTKFGAKHVHPYYLFIKFQRSHLKI